MRQARPMWFRAVPVRAAGQGRWPCSREPDFETRLGPCGLHRHAHLGPCPSVPGLGGTLRHIWGVDNRRSGWRECQTFSWPHRAPWLGMIQSSSGLCCTMARSSLPVSADGLRPISANFSVSRWNCLKGSAVLPQRYRASMSCLHRRSRNGSASTASSRSCISSACWPSRSLLSISSSSAEARRSCASMGSYRFKRRVPTAISREPQTGRTGAGSSG
jgi:hypothetical protein